MMVLSMRIGKGRPQIKSTCQFLANSVRQCGSDSSVNVRFNSILLFTLYKIFTFYVLRWEYTNKGEEEGEKKKINGSGRSVRWSEELSFRANHRILQTTALNTVLFLLMYIKGNSILLMIIIIITINVIQPGLPLQHKMLISMRALRKTDFGQQQVLPSSPRACCGQF